MQEWKEKIRIVRGRLAWASLPLCFCGLVLFDAALRFFYRAAGSTRFLDWRAFVFTGAWSLLLTGAAALLPPLGRRIAMGAYAVFFGLLSVVHGVMFNIFGEFFTFSDTNFAGDGAKFFSLSYLNLRKALVASIVLAMLLLAVGAWLVPKRQPGKPRWPRLAGASGAILLSLVSVVLLNRSLLPQADTMTWGSLFDPSSEEQAYKDFTDSNRCLLLAGLYQYTARDFVVSFGLEASPVDLNSLDQFYEERAGQVSGENEYTGLYEGKSLLMVMLESIDTWLLTPEYMPNLYALQQQGTNFVHNYTPLFLSAGTFNTEFISQTGLLPSVTGLSSSIYSTNSFPFSLAHQFSQQGYTVGSFHTASAGIYSRGSIHQNLGMTYHSGAEMGMGRLHAGQPDDGGLRHVRSRGAVLQLHHHLFRPRPLYRGDGQHLRPPLGSRPGGGGPVRRGIHPGQFGRVHPRRGPRHGDGPVHRRAGGPAGGRRPPGGHGAAVLHRPLRQVPHR